MDIFRRWWGEHLEKRVWSLRRKKLLDEAFPVQKMAEPCFPEKLQGYRSCQEQEDDSRSVPVDLSKLDRLRRPNDHDLVTAKWGLLGLAGVRKGDLRVECGAAEAFTLHD